MPGLLINVQHSAEDGSDDSNTVHALVSKQISVGAQGSVWTGKIKDLQVVLKILGHGQSSEFFNTEYAAVVELAEYQGAAAGTPTSQVRIGGQCVQHKRMGDQFELAVCAHQILLALNACHLTGVYHRDIKPENILIMCERGVVCCKLADFGSALLGTPGKPCSTQVPAGSIAYASPETFCVFAKRQSPGEFIQLWGHLPLSALLHDPAPGDVWSFAATLYTVAAGVHPFRSASPHCPKFRAFMQRYYEAELAHTNPVPCLAAQHSIWHEASAQTWEWPADFSLELQDLLVACWHPRPTARPTVQRLLQHPWLRARCSGFLAHLHRQVAAQPCTASVQVRDVLPAISNAMARCNQIVHERAFHDSIVRLLLLHGQHALKQTHGAGASGSSPSSMSTGTPATAVAAVAAAVAKSMPLSVRPPPQVHTGLVGSTGGSLSGSPHPVTRGMQQPVQSIVRFSAVCMSIPVLEVPGLSRGSPMQGDSSRVSSIAIQALPGLATFDTMIQSIRFVRSCSSQFHIVVSSSQAADSWADSPRCFHAPSSVPMVHTLAMRSEVESASPRITEESLQPVTRGSFEEHCQLLEADYMPQRRPKVASTRGGAGPAAAGAAAAAAAAPAAAGAVAAVASAAATQAVAQHLRAQAVPAPAAAAPAWALGAPASRSCQSQGTDVASRTDSLSALLASSVPPHSSGCFVQRQSSFEVPQESDGSAGQLGECGKPGAQYYSPVSTMLNGDSGRVWLPGFGIATTSGTSAGMKRPRGATSSIPGSVSAGTGVPVDAFELDVGHGASKRSHNRVGSVVWAAPAGLGEAVSLSGSFEACSTSALRQGSFDSLTEPPVSHLKLSNTPGSVPSAVVTARAGSSGDPGAFPTHRMPS